MTIKLRASIIKLAIQEAYKSDGYFRVGALIFHKKSVLGTGHNYTERSVRSISHRFIKHKYGIHAEVAAIIASRQLLRGKSILVVRLNKAGDLMMAKPCSHCMEYLDFVGIRHIYYSDRGQIYKLR